MKKITRKITAMILVVSCLLNLSGCSSAGLSLYENMKTIGTFKDFSFEGSVALDDKMQYASDVIMKDLDLIPEAASMIEGSSLKYLGYVSSTRNQISFKMYFTTDLLSKAEPAVMGDYYVIDCLLDDKTVYYSSYFDTSFDVEKFDDATIIDKKGFDHAFLLEKVIPTLNLGTEQEAYWMAHASVSGIFNYFTDMLSKINDGAVYSVFNDLDLNIIQQGETTYQYTLALDKDAIINKLYETITYLASNDQKLKDGLVKILESITIDEYVGLGYTAESKQNFIESVQNMEKIDAEDINADLKHILEKGDVACIDINLTGLIEVVNGNVMNITSSFTGKTNDQLAIQVPEANPFNFSVDSTFSIKETVMYFDSQGGSVQNYIGMGYGSAVGPLPTTEKLGYDFEGWYTEPAGKGIQVTADTIYSIKDNLTVYANWKIKQYVINFETNGGNKLNSLTQNYNVLVGENSVESPIKDGYTFVGWYTDAKFANKVCFPYNIGAADALFYAKWTINKGNCDDIPKAVIAENIVTDVDGKGVTISAEDIVNIGSGNVGITSDSVQLSIPASIILNLISDKDTNDITSTLNLVQKPSNATTLSSVKTMVTQENVIVSSIDINLTKIYSNGTTEAVHQLGDKIKIVLKLTDEQSSMITDPTKALLYYNNTETNQIEKVDATFDITAKTVTFYTDHFSTYFMSVPVTQSVTMESSPVSQAPIAVEAVTVSAQTGDSNQFLVLYVMLVMISSLTLVISRKKKNA